MLHWSLEAGNAQKEAMGNIRLVKRQKQYSFHGKAFEAKDCFGGSLLSENPKTNPKGRRPLSSKLPVHLVLRTHTKNSMRKPGAFGMVHRVLFLTAKKHGVKMYKYSNNGNHLHIVVKIPHVKRWAAYIRELTGRLSQQMQKLKGREKGEKYWTYRPYTRVVKTWRKAYQILLEYVELNELEAD